MEILEKVFSPSTKLDDVLFEQIVNDDFLLGYYGCNFLSKPSLENAVLIKEKILMLPESKRSNFVLLLLEILTRVLYNSNKQEKIASIFIEVIKSEYDFSNHQIKSKLERLFCDLLERVSCESGLELFKAIKDLAFISHPVKDLNQDTINALDISVPSEIRARFQSATTAYSVCKKIGKYTVLNSLAFQCIHHVLVYEISDFNPYWEPLEEKLKEHNDLFTFEQRQKLVKIYKNIMKSVNKPETGDIVRNLEKFQFSDRTCVNFENLDFNYLIEDLLQFKLSDQVIREKLKVLHGRYKGKAFAGDLLFALRAITDDDPGYEAMEKISGVLKPMKILSKNEYKRFRRNEKKIMCYEPKYENLEKKVFPPEGNIEKINGYIILLEEPNNVHTEIRQILEKIEEIAKKKHNDAKVVLFGSFESELKINGSCVDISINSSSVSDSFSFILALKVELINTGDVVIVPSKSLPMICYKPNEQELKFNITVNNQIGIESTKIIKSFTSISPNLIKLVKNVKLWAKKNDLLNPKKGRFSGYELTLLVIGFLQISKIIGSVNEMSSRLEAENINDLFYKFLRFVYYLEDQTIDITNGEIKKIKSQNWVSVLEPATNKEFPSRIKKPRKEAKISLLLVESTLDELIS